MSLEENELPSEDSSDEDYVPQGAESGGASEEEVSGDEGEEHPPSDDEGDEKKTAGSKRGKSSRKKKFRKKMKLKEEGKEEVKAEQKVETLETEEDKKKKADALWADFLKDCGPPAKKDAGTSNDALKTTTDEKENEAKVSENKPIEEKVKITQIFEFAGETVEVEKVVKVGEEPKPVKVSPQKVGGGSAGRGRGGGLSAVLGQIGKKSKLTVLEKTKLDWQKFKTDEGIEEDITTHNKGRNGYLEKQDFLQRADFRQFEVEKALRTSRSNR